MGIIIGIVVVGILFFVGLSVILYFKDKKLSKTMHEFIYNYDKDVNSVGKSDNKVADINDNQNTKRNTITTDNTGRKTVVIYPIKDCKEGITISWDNGKVRRK